MARYGEPDDGGDTTRGLRTGAHTNVHDNEAYIQTPSSANIELGQFPARQKPQVNTDGVIEEETETLRGVDENKTNGEGDGGNVESESHSFIYVRPEDRCQISSGCQLEGKYTCRAWYCCDEWGCKKKFCSHHRSLRCFLNDKMEKWPEVCTDCEVKVSRCSWIRCMIPTCIIPLFVISFLVAYSM